MKRRDLITAPRRVAGSGSNLNSKCSVTNDEHGEVTSMTSPRARIRFLRPARWFRKIVAGGCLLSGVGLTVLLGPCPAFALDLVRAGQARSVIVVPRNAFPVVKFAAEELRHHIERATGAKLAVVTEGGEPGAGGCVYLGACEATARAGIRTDTLGPNGYVIRLAAEHLHMVGDDSDGRVTGMLINNLTRVGTLFAVYEFLEKQLQGRWLWPGELGEVIPRCMDVTVTRWNSTGKPAFVHARWRDGGVYMGGTNGWSSAKARDVFAEEQSKWLRRHRFARGVNLDAAHAFTTWWERYHESHPEYFNLLPDGSRRSDPTYHGGAPSLISMCVSEPGFHRAIVEHWQRTRSPQRPFIDASENDTNGRCTCPRCLAWDEPDPELNVPWAERLECARKAFAAGEHGGDVSAGSKGWEKMLGSLSDRYAKYFLAVQAEAQKVDPGAVVLGYAYANYVNPPLATRLNERIIIGVVPPMYFPWTDAKREDKPPPVGGLGRDRRAADAAAKLDARRPQHADDRRAQARRGLPFLRPARDDRDGLRFAHRPVRRARPEPLCARPPARQPGACRRSGPRRVLLGLRQGGGCGARLLRPLGKGLRRCA